MMFSDGRIPLTAVAIAALVFTLVTTAGTRASADTPAPGEISIEAGASPAIVEVYLAQISYALWEYGEVQLGPGHLRRVSDEGRANAFSLTVGYRQYFWRGLHAAIGVHNGYDRFESSVDGETYPAFWIWTEVYLGYRFEIDLGGPKLLIIPEPGIGFPVYLSNPWPGAKDRDPVELVPMVWVGVEL